MVEPNESALATRGEEQGVLQRMAVTAARKVIVAGGDTSSLSREERVAYSTALCRHLGIDPLTQPVSYHKFSGERGPETLYFNAVGTSQLALQHGLTEEYGKPHEDYDRGIYVAHCTVTGPNGRSVRRSGAVSTEVESWTGPQGQRYKETRPAKGQELANIWMKAETKAARRATLAYCGLSAADNELDVVSTAHAVIDAQGPPPVVERDTPALDTGISWEEIVCDDHEYVGAVECPECLAGPEAEPDEDAAFRELEPTPEAEPTPAGDAPPLGIAADIWDFAVRAGGNYHRTVERMMGDGEPVEEKNYRNMMSVLQLPSADVEEAVLGGDATSWVQDGGTWATATLLVCEWLAEASLVGSGS